MAEQEPKMTNLEKLSALAKAATQGPWRYDYGNWNVECRSKGEYEVPSTGEKHSLWRATICQTNYECEVRPRFANAHEDGEFIAAVSPDTVLSLISRIESLEERVREAEAVIEFYGARDTWLCSQDMQFGDLITGDDLEKDSPITKRKFIGGKRARAYLNRHKQKGDKK
jgi:hypothetical protein